MSAYSYLWRYRYLWAFIATAILLTLATIFTKGIDFIAKDPYTLGGLILLFGAGCCFSQYGERDLASTVVVKPDGLEVSKFKSTHLVRFERIVYRELLNYKKSKNNFGISELLLKDVEGVTYYIPTNIKNYKQIEQALTANEI